MECLETPTSLLIGWCNTFTKVHIVTETIALWRLCRRTRLRVLRRRRLPGRVDAHKWCLMFLVSCHSQTDTFVVLVYTPATRDPLDVFLEGCCMPSCWRCRMCHLCWNQRLKMLYLWNGKRWLKNMWETFVEIYIFNRMMSMQKFHSLTFFLRTTILTLYISETVYSAKVCGRHL